MQLEQTLEMYRPIQTHKSRAMLEQRQRSYTSRDLESLSASALYTGEIQSGANDWHRNIPTIGGRDNYSFRGRSIFDRLDSSVDLEVQRIIKAGQEAHKQNQRMEAIRAMSTMGLSRPLKYEPLSGVSLPESDVQLHIHERPGGTAHIKYKDGTYTELSSYDAAMADRLAEKFDFKRFLTSCKLKLPESE